MMVTRTGTLYNTSSDVKLRSAKRGKLWNWHRKKGSVLEENCESEERRDALEICWGEAAHNLILKT